MFIDLIKDSFKSNPNHTALIWNNIEFNNSHLSKLLDTWIKKIIEYNIPQGSVISIEGDYSPNAIALILALIELKCIILPQSNSNNQTVLERINIALVEYRFHVDESDNVTHHRTGNDSTHPLYKKIRDNADPGLVLFSSGSSGIPKAAVHNFSPLLEKYLTKRKSHKTIIFLLFDHWGGLNTLFNTLTSSGTAIIVKSRSPDNICNVVEKYNVSLLPATPSFLNMLLISQAYKKYDLSSLQLITYGAEPMPESTLLNICIAIPNARFQQTYGLIEVGVLSTRSLDKNSLLMKVGGEGYSTRIIDGLLQIKTKSMILGYLNASSPITSDGWFMTGDSVETHGDYIKILGRKSELINVGGEKVYPTEVENIILESGNISDVYVYGEKNIFMGNIICAKLSTIDEEDPNVLTERIKHYCRSRLEKYKVPVKIYITNSILYSERFKKIRGGKANDKT
jgi:long-chain acyl-CoA synthetase